MRTFFWCVVGTAFVASAAAASGQESRPAWIEDLDALVAELPKRHVNLFHATSAEAWEASVAALRPRLPTLDDATAFVELRRLVATLNDAHTTVYPGAGGTVPGARRLPLALAWAEEGPLLWAVPVAHGEAAGRRVVAFGGVPWDEAARRLGACVSAENDSWRRHLVADLALDVATLKTLGLCAEDGATALEVVDDAGATSRFVIRPPKDAADAKTFRFVRKPDFGDLAPTLDLARPTYGSRIFPETATLFFWYDACRSDRDRPLADVVAATLRDLDAGLAATPPTITRVVVDLRRNSGGNSVLLEPFIFELARRPAINRPEALRVLVGRRTFSSAVLNAFRFRKATKAVLYGEPTGGALNGYGEIKTFNLPRSGVVVQYCTKRFLLDPTVPGKTLDPDVVVPWLEADVRAGRDAVFEAACR